MANELVFSYPTGATLYALLFDATGQVWDGATFAAPGSAAWTDYDIAMSEVATATGIYRASMPAAAAGSYGWVVRKQAGGSPAVSDVVVGSGEIRWTGTAEETVPASANVTMWQGDPVNDMIDGEVPAKIASTSAQTIANATKLLPGAGLPAIGSIAYILPTLPTDADVQAAATAALTAYDPPTAAELTSAVAALAQGHATNMARLL